MKSAAALFLTIVLSGCANFSYYLHTANGQLDIWERTQPVEKVLANKATPLELKSRLEMAEKIREYASRNLDLPENGSYRKYADLQRTYAVWVVFAAPEFSVEPKQWCFAFAGCVAYRGYFSLEKAQQFAGELKQQNYDVFVAGVPAYSTLGWFDDPLLNTFIDYPETELARLIFHELAHQLVYVPHDTMFNESFATTVEQEGLERWLKYNGNMQWQSAFEETEKKKQEFIGLVLEYRKRLEALFTSSSSDEEKRSAKNLLLHELKIKYLALHPEESVQGSHDQWVNQDLNNAYLASVAIYTQLVPAFRVLLKQYNGDLRQFYAAVKKLAELSPAARKDALDRLIAATTLTTSRP